MSPGDTLAPSSLHLMPEAGHPPPPAMPVTIRSRLLLLVLSVLLPGMLGVAWLIGSTYQAERDAHERTLRDTARAMSRLVDGELQRRATIAHVLSQAPSLDSPAQMQDPAHRLAFERLARRAMQGLEGWVELREPGRVIINTRVPDGVNGEGPAPEKLSAQGVMQPLAPLTGPATRFATGPELHAAWVQPVYRNGVLVYNLVVTVRPPELQKLVQANPGWVGTVMDSTGRVVARKPGGDSFVGRESRAELRATMAGKMEGSFESISLDGIPTAGYFATSSLGWTYVTAMPRQDFIGTLPRQGLRTIVGAVLLLTAAVAGTLWVSRRIESAIRALKQAAVDMQAGRPPRTKPTGIVETDGVADAMTNAGRTMASARTELEQSVAEAVERTRQMEQRGAQSQRVEALGRLTGGVAHEFNNLLGIISNSMHLLQRHAAAATELQAPIAATQRAVDKGSQLTQHLLRFSGRRSVRIQQLSLARYLPEVQELMRSTLGRRIEIQVHVAAHIAPVRVDPSELDLALVNLALNAHDAMPNGGELRVQARNATPEDTEGLPPGDYVLITGSDDGVGREPELAERVFEPLATTHPVGQGSGLGLSQVYGFATQAGGTARLASTPGLGTTVSLLLPTASQADEQRPARPIMDAAQHSIAGATVMLVEDDDALGAVTAALLMTHGAKVMRANRGDAAMRLMEAGVKPDVVLTDVVMPGKLDGIALARQLRDQYPGVPLVLISGFSQTAIAEGEFTLLRKPCPPAELLGALQAAIASGRAAAVAATATEAATSEPS